MKMEEDERCSRTMNLKSRTMIMEEESMMEVKQ